MISDLGQNLYRYSAQKFLIWDVESCNLNIGLTENKVWQLSWIVCDKDKILEEYNYYPWWDGIQVSRDAARITRFDFNDYKSKATDPAEALNKFESFLYDPQYISVGHNHYNFDFFMHTLYRKSLGLKSDYSYIYNGALDSNALARAIKLSISIPVDKKDRVAMMYKLSGLRQKGLKTSLGHLLKEEGIPHSENELHNGIVDCQKNFEIYKRQLWRVEI